MKEKKKGVTVHLFGVAKDHHRRVFFRHNRQEAGEFFIVLEEDHALFDAINGLHVTIANRHIAESPRQAKEVEGKKS